MSGDDTTKAQWKLSMAMNYNVVLCAFLVGFKFRLACEIQRFPFSVEVSVNVDPMFHLSELLLTGRKSSHWHDPSRSCVHTMLARYNFTFSW